MAPPGLAPLGAKGSVRDRLTPPGQAECLPAQGSYIVSLRWWGMAPMAAESFRLAAPLPNPLVSLCRVMPHSGKRVYAAERRNDTPLWA